jgi:hypothetical protein
MFWIIILNIPEYWNLIFGTLLLFEIPHVGSFYIKRVAAFGSLVDIWTYTMDDLWTFWNDTIVVVSCCFRY